MEDDVTDPSVEMVALALMNEESELPLFVAMLAAEEWLATPVEKRGPLHICEDLR